MSLRHKLWVLVPVISLTMLTGCGNSSTDGGASVADSDAADQSLLGDILSDVDLTDETGEQSAGTATTGDSFVSVTSGGIDATPNSNELKLRLKKGDRFPLTKTVQQTLIQNSRQSPASAQTRLDLFMEINVQDVQPESVVMQIVYKRIAYSQQIAGHSLSYDSATNRGPVPAELVPYAGMVENGFSFRLGKDNRIREVLGFNEFLQRCVQRVIPDQRQALITTLASRFGEDGVAGFVDDTIGLLPYSTTSGASPTVVAEGDEWVRRQSLSGDSGELQTTCRLLSLGERTAEITLTGKVLPATVAAGSQPAVSITGGRSTGSCVLNRQTGLPVEVNRSQYLQLAVRTPDGGIVQQQKQIKTTIRTAANGPVVQNSHGIGLPVPPTIQQVSGVRSAVGVDNISTSNLSSTTTAVYPPNVQ